MMLRIWTFVKSFFPGSAFKCSVSVWWTASWYVHTKLRHRELINVKAHESRRRVHSLRREISPTGVKVATSRAERRTSSTGLANTLQFCSMASYSLQSKLADMEGSWILKDWNQGMDISHCTLDRPLHYVVTEWMRSRKYLWNLSNNALMSCNVYWTRSPKVV